MSLITLERNIHQGRDFRNNQIGEPRDEERKTVRKRRVRLKLISLLAVPLLVMVALPAGIKEVYWIALVFMVVSFAYMFAFFVSTFFSRKALKLRKSIYKKE